MQRPSPASVRSVISSRVGAVGAVTAALALAACGGGGGHARGPEPPSGPDLSPALAPIAWLVGDWQRDDGGGEEHWVAIAGVMYGVGFGPGGTYELMIVDDADEHADGKPDGTLRLFAMPGGAPPTVFLGRNDAAAQVDFTNPAHDDPTAISYRTVADQLVATVAGPNGELTLAMSAGRADRAPEAEAADVDFARDADADDADGWVRWFADDGAMIRGDQRIEGHAAVKAAIAPLLDRASLLWSPSWSRLSPDGSLAVTVGRARIVERAAVTWRGSYLTLWRHDPGGWRVVADVGRGENPL